MRVGRIELLRQETADAERRAGQVAEEMKELVAQLSRKQKSLEDKSTELGTCGLPFSILTLPLCELQGHEKPSRQGAGIPVKWALPRNGMGACRLQGAVL